MLTRYGEMLDMMNCMAIYNGGAEQKTKKKRVTSFGEAILLR